MKRTIGLIVLWCALSACSLAQENEISFSIGAMASSDQQTIFGGLFCPIGLPNCNGPFNSSTSTGVAFEGNLSRRIFNFHVASLSVELPILGVPGRDMTTTLAGTLPARVSQSSIFFTPSARMSVLPSSPISPFFSFGGGLAHHHAGSSINRGTLQYGGGVDFKTPLPHIKFRAEVRDFWARGFNENSGLTHVSPERQHNVFAGGGLVLRF